MRGRDGQNFCNKLQGCDNVAFHLFEGDGDVLRDKYRKAVFYSFLAFMRPAARLLLRCGVPWKDAAELTKMAFVDVAAKDYGKHGRPANTSRIALVTGLGRREVKRVRDLLEAPDAIAADGVLVAVNQASRVLSGWHQDPNYLTASGKPKLLKLDGPHGFLTLTAQYAPDIPPVAVLKELKSVGAVRETDSGKLRVLERYYMPSKFDENRIARSGNVLGDFASTVVSNLFAGKKPNLFEGRATNLLVKRRAVKQFQAYLEQHAMAFLEDADAWLSAHEVANDSEPKVRVGIGVYMIKDDERR